ncbi:hypothetical protein CEXT_152821 [Caerostris extrusa]|uniref:Uncharacterized protein n=1 Tax=Caerostris extrusa TaxID=172846 RepID=A0AAV4TTH4_CAEEX|nr:hypothetical protein CEXT_152821 [Caerostris extrusa]
MFSPTNLANFVENYGRERMLMSNNVFVNYRSTMEADKPPPLPTEKHPLLKVLGSLAPSGVANKRLTGSKEVIDVLILQLPSLSCTPRCQWRHRRSRFGIPSRVRTKIRNSVITALFSISSIRVSSGGIVNIVIAILRVKEKKGKYIFPRTVIEFGAWRFHQSVFGKGYDTESGDQSTRNEMRKLPSIIDFLARYLIAAISLPQISLFFSASSLLCGTRLSCTRARKWKIIDS